ncbi:hypothetical protein [Deinococcus sp. QL22]|uniref:hypothetical protein n=1 Tax=Deinococcus sp. QL22 TaxID=2939437 RepID=UPI002017D632|nr:hypothetical protein [Deinococcus sp. QL22]UQN09344.1 hypothetical protein M1R55_22525 [Deinococcus sp. QL22]
MTTPPTASEAPTSLQHHRTRRQVAEALALLAGSPREADLASWLKTWYLSSVQCAHQLDQVYSTAQYLAHRPRPFLA